MSEAMEGTGEIPLFPLGTVLFAGGRLPLRIFEPRYLDLVSRCMKEQTGFGVVLIREGSEVLRPATPGGAADASPQRVPETAMPTLFQVGTYARIVDFNALDGGALGIVCAGGERFRVRQTRVADDHLVMAEVEFLPDEAATPVADDFVGMVDTLRVLAKHPLVQQMALDIDYDDARSVSCRLADLLPLDMPTRQTLLELPSAHGRLAEIQRLVVKLKG